MIPEPIRELLDELYERYDTPGFIEDDPISVPHGFTRAGVNELVMFETEGTYADAISLRSEPLVVPIEKEGVE